MARLVMQLFGSPRIEVGGKPVSVDTRKATALLVYLAVAGGSHSRDFLAALLWPEYDQSSARGALRRTLSTLRKGAGEEFLEASWEAVSLAKGADLWLDVSRFKSLLEDCKRQCPAPDAGCSACLARLNEAVALYRGDFLAGFSLRDSPNFDEWQFYQGDELRRLLAEALERLVYAHFARSDFEAAISSARRWLSLDPLREEAHRLLMQCYAWSGERGAALRQYRECVRILQEELGVPPLEETTDHRAV
jgi:DNA-binding SARP family transcriptional activator